jgi:hypothetical protein
MDIEWSVGPELKALTQSSLEANPCYRDDEPEAKQFIGHGLRALYLFNNIQVIWPTTTTPPQSKQPGSYIS